MNEDKTKRSSKKGALLPVPYSPDSMAMVPEDPLRRYMIEVQKYPMLTEDEERSLVADYHKTGNIDAAKRLVAAHLRLVVKIAMEYRNAYYNTLDLIQEGSLGLLHAVKKFDPEKNARFGYYATWWIRSYILKYILDNFRLIKIGTTKTQKRLFYNLMQEKQKIESLGYKASGHALSKRLGVTEGEVIDMQRRLESPEMLLSQPVGNDDKGALLEEFIADNDVPMDEKIAAHEREDIYHKKFEDFAKTLKPRELKIFKERLVAEVPVTLQAIADEYSISKERARQIESRIMEKLKEHFKESGVNFNEKIF